MARLSAAPGLLEQFQEEFGRVRIALEAELRLLNLRTLVKSVRH